MTFIAVTAGMVLKAIYISLRNFQRKDLLTLGLGLGAGLILVAKLYEDHEVGDLIDPWLGLPLGFAAVVAFGFKDRLLPAITESTLLAYGLVGSYLFFTHFVLTDIGTTFIDTVFFIFICCYVGLSLLLILYNKIISKRGQTLLMALFIMMSVFIGYLLAAHTFTLEVTYWEAAIIGYCYLPLVANVLYLLYFVPIPLSKHESFTERFAKIRAHSIDLEEKFISTDATHIQLIGVVVLFGVMVLMGSLTAMSEVLLVAFVLTIETFINRTPYISSFTPITVKAKL
jgi:hypothetical protein